jgi:hypothetical protein
MFYSVLERLDLGVEPTGTTSSKHDVGDDVHVTANADSEGEQGRMHGKSDGLGKFGEESQTSTCMTTGVTTGCVEGGNNSRRAGNRELVPNELAMAEFDSMLASRSS